MLIRVLVVLQLCHCGKRPVLTRPFYELCSFYHPPPISQTKPPRRSGGHFWNLSFQPRRSSSSSPWPCSSASWCWSEGCCVSEGQCAVRPVCCVLSYLCAVCCLRRSVYVVLSVCCLLCAALSVWCGVLSVCCAALPQKISVCCPVCVVCVRVSACEGFYQEPFGLHYLVCVLIPRCSCHTMFLLCFVFSRNQQANLAYKVVNKHKKEEEQKLPASHLHFVFCSEIIY